MTKRTTKIISFSLLLLLPALPNWLNAQRNEPGQISFELEDGIASSPGASGVQETGMPLRRRILRDDISISVRNVRLESGQRVKLVIGTPKKAKQCPAVFVFDVETNNIANKGPLSYNNLNRKNRQSGYLLWSPFGSNMLGNGFAVAYVIAEDLSVIRSARSNDWIGLFERVRKQSKVDDNSMFLFATREWANSAIYLASRYDFSGYIQEAPNYMLFTSQNFDSVIKRSDQLASDEIWRATDPSREHHYYRILSQIRTPIMLIRNKNSYAYNFNQKTLISKLHEANTYFETVEVPGPARRLTTFGGDGVLAVEPDVAYYPSLTSKVLEEMISYMRINSSTEAVSLRDPTRFGSR